MAILAKEAELEERGYVSPRCSFAWTTLAPHVRLFATTGTIVVAGEIRTQLLRVDVQERLIRNTLRIRPR